MSEWVEVEKELPERDDIYKVKLQNGDEIKAYFYHDKMNWLLFYGMKTSHWWKYGSNEPLFDVVEWQKKSNIKE